MNVRLTEKQNFLALSAFCILTVIIYSGMLKYPILSNDDIVFFTKYPEILDLSWKSIFTCFSSYHASLYQPLTVVTFAINYYFTGTSPVSLHLVNLAFHLANVILVYHLFRSLTGNSIPALFISFLFAVHPMNVEAVTWISARSSAMYATFYLLSLIFYVQYSRKNRTTLTFLLTLFFFILSLFCKVQAVTLPLVLFLFDYFSNRKNFRIILLEKIPFLMLSLAFLIIAFRNPATSTFYSQSQLHSFSGTDLIFLNGRTLFFYLQKFLVPLDLSAVYVFPVKNGIWLPPAYYISTLTVILLCLVVIKFRKNRQIIFGALFFLVTISVNLPLISVRSILYADRYAYLPFLGFMAIAASLYYSITDKHAVSHRKAVFGLTIGILIYGLVLAFETRERNKAWESDLTLSTDIINKNPPVPFMSKIYRKRGNYYSEHGMTEASISDYSKAVELDPEDVDSYIFRAYAHIRMNHLKDALPDLDKGIESRPDASILYANRAMVRLNLHDNPGAWRDCNTCLSLDSTNAEAYNFRAVVLFQSNDLAGARHELSRAIRFNKRYAEAYKNLGTVLYQEKDLSQACYYWEVAARLGDRQAVQLMQNNCRRK